MTKLQSSSINPTLNNESVSIYKDSLTQEHLTKEIVRLKKSFPQLPIEFYDILLDRLKANGFTNQRLTDAMNNLIDHFTYPMPTIANIISFDKRVKLYNYYEIIEMVIQNGIKVWDNFKPVKSNSKQRLYAEMKDIIQYKLELDTNE